MGWGQRLVACAVVGLQRPAASSRVFYARAPWPSRLGVARLLELVLWCRIQSRRIHRAMAASVHRLRTRRQRLRAEQGEALRQAILGFPDLPPDAVTRVVAAVDAETASANGWTFVMLSPADNAKVVSSLIASSALPMVAVRLWSNLFVHLRHDTGEIAQSREELAEAVGVQPRDVSRIMTELEGLGAIRRELVKVPGLRGRGMVRYFMNPKVATRLAGTARDRAQAEAPLLRLVSDAV